MRLSPLFAVSALLAVAALPACEGAEPRPLTARTTRLGTHPAATARPLDRSRLPPARSLLVSGPLVEVGGDRLVARVLLDGPLEGGRIDWSSTGARPDGASDLEATFVRAGGPWTIRAILTRDGRTLDSGEVSGGGAPRIVAGWDRAVVAEAPPGSTLEIRDGESLEGLSPGQTVSVRWVGGDDASPWSSATAGALPSGPARLLPLDPLGCGDRHFPRRVGAGHVGCSGAADPAGLDLWLAPGASAPTAIEDLPARHGRPPPPAVLADRAAVSSGPGRALIWATNELGSWLPGRATSSALGRRTMRGRPASDGVTLAFAGDDRVEVGRLGTSQRFQIPAAPTDQARPLAVSGDWLAVVEGPVGQEGLLLHHVKRHRGGALTTSRPRLPVLAGRWLTWQTEGAVHALSLDGGAGWSHAVRAGEGEPVVLDDWLVVPLRAGGLRALHLPSGLSQDLETGAGIAGLRGASAGALTTWLRQPGEAGTLAEWEVPHRVFEEDGPSGAGDPLAHLPGGHGGARGRLAPGARRSLVLDPGPGTWSLDLWVTGADDAPAPTVQQGERLLPVPPRIAGPGGDEPGRWVPLTALSAGREQGWEQTAVQITWTGGAGGAIVDAVRLRPSQEKR